MSVRAIVLIEVREVGRLFGRSLPPLKDELVLLDSGLDSLGLAVLVTRLEDALGVDPFNESGFAVPPVTLGDFIQLYERAGISIPKDRVRPK